MMQRAAEQRDYEQAALQRNRLQAVRMLMARRRVSSASIGMVDMVAVAVNDGEANAQVFQIRDGVLAERQGFYLTNEGGKSQTEVTEDFLIRFRLNGAVSSEVGAHKRVLRPHEVEASPGGWAPEEVQGVNWVRRQAVLRSGSARPDRRAAGPQCG